MDQISFNSPEEATFEGHVYLDHHHPPILWNIVRGGFDSVDILLKEQRDFAISVSLASMLQNSSAKRLKSELALEVVRRQVSPSSVSRLQGLFVFDDVDSVARIWDSNTWGGHFHQEYLADVGVCARRSSRVDANWIAEIVHTDGSLLPRWQAAAVRYWRGTPHPERPPIWERIVQGSFCVWSMHSRRSALQEVQAIWPESLGLLVHSMNCLALSSMDGQVFPGLRIEGGTVKLDYHLRMLDSREPAFIDRLKRLPLERPELFAGYPGEVLRTPDLTGYSLEIPVADEDLLTTLAAMLLLIRGGDPS